MLTPRAHTQMRVGTNRYACACANARIRVRMRERVPRMYTLKHAHTQPHTHTRARAHTHTHAHAHTHTGTPANAQLMSPTHVALPRRSAHSLQRGGGASRRHAERACRPLAVRSRPFILAVAAVAGFAGRSGRSRSRRLANGAHRGVRLALHGRPACRRFRRRRGRRRSPGALRLSALGGRRKRSAAPVGRGGAIGC